MPAWIHQGEEGRKRHRWEGLPAWGETPVHATISLDTGSRNLSRGPPLPLGRSIRGAISYPGRSATGGNRKPPIPWGHGWRLGSGSAQLRRSSASDPLCRPLPHAGGPRVARAWRGTTGAEAGEPNRPAHGTALKKPLGCGLEALWVGPSIPLGTSSGRPQVVLLRLRSNRSAFMTLVQAATKSATNFAGPSDDP